MANKPYHILNGDALKEQFPENILGEIIVARECLVDGPVSGNSLEEFFETRAKFISSEYGGTREGYFNKVVVEFEKIRNIPTSLEVHLWFEDDLFCQVNLWFVVHLLSKNKHTKIFLIRPPVHNQYGFGGLSKEKLLLAYQKRQKLEKLDVLKRLWPAYQSNQSDALNKLAAELEKEYPFILPAVEAHIDRIPTHNDPGRPAKSLRRIMDELQTKEFGPVFREFNKRESIYGFGDLQVKRLFDSIKK